MTNLFMVVIDTEGFEVLLSFEFTNLDQILGIACVQKVKPDLDTMNRWNVILQNPQFRQQFLTLNDPSV